MPLKIPCTCGRTLLVPDRKAGSVIQCPKCKARLRVPLEHPALFAAATTPPKAEATTSVGTTATITRSAPAVAAAPKPPPLPRPATVKPAQTPVIESKPRPSVTAKEPVAAPPRTLTQPFAAAPTPTVAATRPAIARTPVASPPPSFRPVLPRRGFQHDRETVQAVYYLGYALLLITAVGLVPAVFEIIEHAQTINSLGLSRWALVLLVAAVIQFAYAIYLLQLPDWGSVWVVSIFMLLVSTTYAILLGLALLSKHDSEIIHLLQLSDTLRDRKATLWCAAMVCLTGALSYFGGRIGARWHRRYVLTLEMVTASSRGSS